MNDQCDICGLDLTSNKRMRARHIEMCEALQELAEEDGYNNFYDWWMDHKCTPLTVVSERTGVYHESIGNNLDRLAIKFSPTGKAWRGDPEQCKNCGFDFVLTKRGSLQSYSMRHVKACNKFHKLAKDKGFKNLADMYEKIGYGLSELCHMAGATRNTKLVNDILERQNFPFDKMPEIKARNKKLALERQRNQELSKCERCKIITLENATGWDKHRQRFDADGKVMCADCVGKIEK